MCAIGGKTASWSTKTPCWRKQEHAVSVQDEKSNVEEN